MNVFGVAIGSFTSLATSGSRMMPLGSRPCATASMSSKKRLRIIATPRSLEPSSSLLRSAIVPWPTQAMTSWLMMWLEIQRPFHP